jgi:hypothetical protein
MYCTHETEHKYDNLHTQAITAIVFATYDLTSARNNSNSYNTNSVHQW